MFGVRTGEVLVELLEVVDRGLDVVAAHRPMRRHHAPAPPTTQKRSAAGGRRAAVRSRAQGGGGRRAAVRSRAQGGGGGPLCGAPELLDEERLLVGDPPQLELLEADRPARPGRGQAGNQGRARGSGLISAAPRSWCGADAPEAEVSEAEVVTC